MNFPVIHVWFRTSDSRRRCRFFPRGLLVFGAAVAVATALHGQGTLTPPGAPAPTMKTLDQIEARTIVNATNTPGDATNSFIISKSGSYYLTGNITGVAGKNGISIQAVDVTLDLNGFTLTGAGTGGDVSTGLRGVITTVVATNSCIGNGSARNWYRGVEAGATGQLVEKLRLYGNYTGLLVGNGSIVRDCVATGNAVGFECNDRTQLTHCIATENVGDGYLCQNFVSLLDCTSSRNGGRGFSVENGCSLIRCTASRNVEYGVSTGAGCTISSCTTTNNQMSGTSTGSGCSVVDCTSADNTESGIAVLGESTVRGCTVQGNTSFGILGHFGGCHFAGNTCTRNGVGLRVRVVSNRVEGNICLSNTGIGFSIEGSRNLVVRNSASNNGTNYYFEGVTTAVAIDLRAGGSDANTPPWANFIY